MRQLSLAQAPFEQELRLVEELPLEWVAVGVVAPFGVIVVVGIELELELVLVLVLSLAQVLTELELLPSSPQRIALAA